MRVCARVRRTALVKLHLPRSTNAQDANAPDASAPDATNEAAHCHWNACRLVLASTQIMYYAIHGTGTAHTRHTLPPHAVIRAT
jgi:hypothetical protein